MKTQGKLKAEELIGKLFHGKAYTSEVKTADDNARTLIVKISSINPDRSNDIVVPEGADITNFKKNPVVLLSHNYQSLPIAKCIGLEIGQKDIIAKVLFPDAGIYDVADTVFEMCKQGFMNAWSIGFIPNEYTERKDESGYGYTFTKWQLLEFSAVSVPDNQDALTIARSKGIDVDLLEKDQDLAQAEDAVRTLDEADNDTSDTETETPIEEEKPEDEKSVEEAETKEVVVKTGRTISKQNESKIKAAIDALTEVLNSLEKEVEEPAEPEETPEVEPEKSIESTEPTLLRKLQHQLKDTDKSVGLTLRLIKSIQAEN